MKRAEAGSKKEEEKKKSGSTGVRGRERHEPTGMHTHSNVTEKCERGFKPRQEQELVET